MLNVNLSFNTTLSLQSSLKIEKRQIKLCTTVQGIFPPVLLSILKGKELDTVLVESISILLRSDNSAGGSGVSPVYQWRKQRRLTTRSVDEQIKYLIIWPI
jgi:hypothetical protein